MQWTQLHLIGFLVTLAVVTLVGLGAARKVKNAADFTIGGKASGIPLIVGAITGTIVGGASTIGTAQLAFTIGLSAWWFTLGAGLALLSLALLYAKPLRSSGLQTIPEFLALHYGSTSEKVTAISSSLGIFFALVANILSATPLVSAVLGMNAVEAAGVVLLLIMAYVVFGGVWGAGLAGIVKTVLIVFTVFTAGITAFQGMGGSTGVYQVYATGPWLSLLGRGWQTDVASALSLIVGTLSTQTYIQAVYSAKNVKVARQGAFLAALITLPMGLPSVFVGLFMREYHPDIAPIDALPLFIMQYLPPWLGGIAIAALLLASIGGAAGLALGVGTILAKDLLSAGLKTLTSRKLLLLNRCSVLFIVVAATLFSFGNLRSVILEWNFLSMALRGAGIFLPLTLAAFWPGRVESSWAVGAMASGSVVAFLWKGLYPQGLDPLYAGLAVSALCLSVGIQRKKGSIKVLTK